MIGCVRWNGLVKVARSKWRVEADLGDSDGRGFGRGSRVVMVAAGVGEARGGYHVFAFEATAINARCKRADAIPWRVEGVITALQLGVRRGMRFRGTATGSAVQGGTTRKVQGASWLLLEVWS